MTRFHLFRLKLLLWWAFPFVRWNASHCWTLLFACSYWPTNDMGVVTFLVGMTCCCSIHIRSRWAFNRRHRYWATVRDEHCCQYYCSLIHWRPGDGITGVQPTCLINCDVFQRYRDVQWLLPIWALIPTCWWHSTFDLRWVSIGDPFSIRLNPTRRPIRSRRRRAVVPFDVTWHCWRAVIQRRIRPVSYVVVLKLIVFGVPLFLL